MQNTGLKILVHTENEWQLGKYMYWGIFWGFCYFNPLSVENLQMDLAKAKLVLCVRFTHVIGGVGQGEGPVVGPHVVIEWQGMPEIIASLCAQKIYGRVYS